MERALGAKRACLADGPIARSGTQNNPLSGAAHSNLVIAAQVSCGRLAHRSRGT